MQTLNDYISPTKLVMIRLENNCMFCDNPTGESNTRYVYLEEHMGYIYCDKCIKAADISVNYWINNMAYGKANYLKNKIIKVRRSSGLIETGWELRNPFTNINYEYNIEFIQCYNDVHKILRWCILDEILELNPK